MVVVGGYLDHIHAYQLDRGQTSHYLQRLMGGKPTRNRCASAGRIGRVECINIERDVGLVVTGDQLDLFNRGLNAVAMDVDVAQIPGEGPTHEGGRAEEGSFGGRRGWARFPVDGI